MRKSYMEVLYASANGGYPGDYRIMNDPD